MAKGSEGTSAIDLDAEGLSIPDQNTPGTSDSERYVEAPENDSNIDDSVGLVANANKEIGYIDQASEVQTTDEYDALEDDTFLLTAGWYVVRKNIELTEPLVIDGEVNLILTNGHRLTANEGILVKKDSRLSLYGEQNASGELLVRKGVRLSLTAEEQKEHDEELTYELERNPNYKEEKPELLRVLPCLYVVAGEHEPWPADNPEPDPDPQNAPKHVKNPLLNNELLQKKYLLIRPSSHEFKKDGEYFVVEDGHFTCVACDGWYEDTEGHYAVQKSQPEEDSGLLSVTANPAAEDEEDSSAGAGTLAAEASTGAVKGEASKVTFTFDANGGSGTMSPVEVNKGEGFALPECTFVAPEGMEFSAWDLGEPGTIISSLDSTTVKAQWKAKGGSESGGTSGSGTSSSSQAPQSTSGQSTVPNQGSANNGSSSSNGGLPKMGDSSAVLFDVAGVLLVAGMVLVLAGKSGIFGNASTSK